MRSITVEVVGEDGVTQQATIRFKPFTYNEMAGLEAIRDKDIDSISDSEKLKRWRDFAFALIGRVWNSEHGKTLAELDSEFEASVEAAYSPAYINGLSTAILEASRLPVEFIKKN